VYENVRPDTIVVFKDHSSVLGHSFLVGFEDSQTLQDLISEAIHAG
jgi:hypothetical protein